MFHGHFIVWRTLSYLLLSLTVETELTHGGGARWRDWYFSPLWEASLSVPYGVVLFIVRSPRVAWLPSECHLELGGRAWHVVWRMGLRALYDELSVRYYRRHLRIMELWHMTDVVNELYILNGSYVIWLVLTSLEATHWYIPKSCLLSVSMVMLPPSALTRLFCRGSPSRRLHTTLGRCVPSASWASQCISTDSPTYIPKVTSFNEQSSCLLFYFLIVCHRNLYWLILKASLTFLWYKGSGSTVNTGGLRTSTSIGPGTAQTR